MKHANLSFRHGGGRVYACDLNIYDREKGCHVRIASVPMDEPEGLPMVAPIEAVQLLQAQQLIEKYPPFKGRQKER